MKLNLEEFDSIVLNLILIYIEMEEIYKSVSYSQTTLTELMIPSYANFGGKIHGGILLSLMDKVAYACASKHAGNYCVTVSVDNVEFLQPVDVGEMVSMFASVNYVGNSSLVIGIKVISEDFKIGTVKHTNTSYFTMVAKDENGQVTKVPGLILENKEDARRFLEAIKRKELKSTYKKELDNAKTLMEVDSNKHLFSKERCKIVF
jgi:uncharacterized protein (TIGR00369 family)